MLHISNALANHGYFLNPAFLTPDETAALVSDLKAHHSAGAFRRAGIGKPAELTIADEIRRDETLWFEPSSLSAPQQALWTRLFALKDTLNQELLLGLWDIEGHYAVYPAGGFYRRHLDRFRADDARTVSVVLYLNQAWKPGDGGELVLYRPDGEVRVDPVAGTAAIFLSDQVEHEVLPSRAPRMSFAGWFRRRRVGT
jgi:SM-20-related protein